MSADCPRPRLPLTLCVLIAVAIIGSIWSLQGPAAIDVWAFELIPGMLGVAGLAVTARWFRFSDLVYLTIAAAFVMIAMGARYTYAEMPLFHLLRDALGHSRNHFDRVGHFIQGLTVALMAREVIRRTTDVPSRPGLSVLTVSVALAFSAFYELVEWWCVLIFYPDAGPEWLGLQGDPWDTQWDMALAFAGAMTAATLLAPLHDRSMRRLAAAGNP